MTSYSINVSFYARSRYLIRMIMGIITLVYIYMNIFYFLRLLEYTI